MSPSPSRRGLLQAGLLAPLVAACTRSSPKPVRVDPDDALRDAAVAREQALLALYATATNPALVAIRAEHEQHLTALGSALPSASPSAAIAASHPQLVAAEGAAAAAHAADALRASRGLAAVLGSLAASEASHLVALG